MITIIFNTVVLSLNASAMENQGEAKNERDKYWTLQTYPRTSELINIVGFQKIFPSSLVDEIYVADELLLLDAISCRFDEDLAKSKKNITIIFSRSLSKLYFEKNSGLLETLDNLGWDLKYLKSDFCHISFLVIPEHLEDNKKMLATIQEIEPLFCCILVEVSFILNINTLVDPNEIPEMKQALKEATPRLKDFDCHLTWHLAESYLEDNDYVAALNTYQDIEESNPHYRMAAERCDGIISMVLDLNQQGSYVLDDPQKKYYKKCRFKFALIAGNSRLAGRLFEELSGLLLADCALEQFNGDYDTLIAISEAINGGK
jgi:hypothetical protein